MFRRVVIAAVSFGIGAIPLTAALVAASAPSPSASQDVSARQMMPAATPMRPSPRSGGQIAAPLQAKRRARLPQPSPGSPVAQAAAIAPQTASSPVVAGPYALLSESLTNNFTPPDTQLAAGPGYLLALVNVEGAVYTTAGVQVGSNFSLLDLFPLESGFHFSDPRVAYDPAAGRWIVTILEFRVVTGPPQQVASRVYISTSANVNPDPTVAGSWSWTRVYPVTSADQTIADTELCDQPQLGWSNDKIAVSCNNFNAANQFVNATTRIIDKADLYAGKPIFYQDLTGSFADSAHGSLSPAYSYGDTAIQYLIYNRESTPQNFAGVISVSGRPDSVGGITAAESDLPIRVSALPPAADQPGTTQKLDTGDNRFQGATWRDGKLWTGGDDACQPSGDTAVRSCARLVEVLTGGTLSVNQDFDVGATGQHYLYPRVTMDASDDMVTALTISSTTTYPSFAYLTQVTGDPAGAIDGVSVVAPGQNSYSDPFGNRWGDYSAATPDPLQPGAVWLAAEYMPSANSVYWGTAGARVTLHRAPGCGFASVSADKTSPQALNTAVTFTASGGACASNPQYSFWLQGRINGVVQWSNVRGYDVSPSYTLSYAGLAYGTYTVDVWVRDTGSTSQYDTFALAAWVIGGCNFASTTNTSGTTFTTTAGGVACPTPEYRVWLVGKGLPWTMESDWSANASFDVSSVAGLSANTYTVDVWVREKGISTDPNYLETWGLATYLNSTTACSTSVPVMSATPPSPGTWGTVNLSTTGCGAGAQYKYWLYPGPGNAWQVLRDWGAGAFAWNTSGLAAGNYSLVAWARQTGSNPPDYDSYAVYSYAVGGAVSAAVAPSKASPQPQATVGALTLTASSQGAASPEYSFWILAPGSSQQWQNIQPYGSSATAPWTPPAPGTYAVVVWVRQKGGPTPSGNFESYAALSFTTQ